MFQIFGTIKCKDTQKAIRFFKERRIQFQFIDLTIKGMSRGELKNVLEYYEIDDIVDKDCKDFKKKYKDQKDLDLTETVIEDPLILKTPIIRINRKVKIGFSKEDIENWGV